jgi:hypothetical protein
MAFVFDPAIHMHAAILAGMTLNGRLLVDDLQFVGILGDGDIVTRDDGDLRHGGTRRLPAFAAAANVIMGSLALQGHDHGIAGAFAGQGATGKILGTLLDALIDGRMNCNCHNYFLPLFCTIVVSGVAGPALFLKQACHEVQSALPVLFVWPLLIIGFDDRCSVSKQLHPPDLERLSGRSQGSIH